jgi:hypothetical protein
VNAAFKYDHLIQVWDFTARSKNSRQMLENLVFFGTFIQHETPDDQHIVRNSNDIPQASKKITKNRIEFKDNWQRCGTLAWVSGVTVDGEGKEMYYQIHAGSLDISGAGTMTLS